MKFVNLTPSWPLLVGLLIGGGLGALLGYFGQCTSGTCPLTSTWWRGMIYGAVLGFFFSTAFTRPANSSAHVLPPTREPDTPAALDASASR